MTEIEISNHIKPNDLYTEDYIKGLIKDKLVTFEPDFYREEFTTRDLDIRPDVTVLRDTVFTYYEVKSDKDNYIRFIQQMEQSLGLFHITYLVISAYMLNKYRQVFENFLSYRVGIYLVEDLENNVLEPYKEAEHCWLEVDKVAQLLWVEDLRHYIKVRLNGNIPSGMVKRELVALFTALYSDDDCIKILQEVLPSRNYI